MKKFLAILLTLLAIGGTTYAAPSIFNSNQIASSTPTAGYVPVSQGNNLPAIWTATSSLGISGGASLSGGIPNALTYWITGSTVGATTSPTIGNLTATGTATSTFAGGLQAARLNITGSTTFSGMTANTIPYLNSSKVLSPVSFAAIGSSPNANGLSFTNGVFNLQPASASFGGVVTTGTQTFAGLKTFSATSTFSAAPLFSTMTSGSVLFAGTSGALTQDNSNYYWNDSLNYLGINASANPNAPLDVRPGNAYTISFSGSVTLTATLQELVPAPSASDITSVVNEIASTPSISSVNQNFGSGSYIASGQSINYSVYACKFFGFGTFCTQAGTGGMTDSLNDLSTSFYNSISWSVSSGSPDSYIVCNDQGYCQDVGSNTSVDDYGFGSWSAGFGTSQPSTFGFLSAGGTREYKMHTISTTPSQNTYYSTEYLHTVNEPSSGVYYTVSHTLNSTPTGSGSWDIGQGVKIIGAEDGASFTNSYSSGSFEEYPGFWGLQSSDLTVTPQSYGFTGSGQTLLYKTRPRANVRGYSDIYSNSTINSNNLTIPNTGSKYYITISTPVPTFNGPSGALQAWYYMFERSSNNGSTFPSYRNAVNASSNWNVTTFYEDSLTSTTSGSYSATPTSFAPAAAVFKSTGGTASPFSTTAGYELSAIFDSNSSSNYAGFEIRNGGNRSAAFYAQSSSAFMDVASSFSIRRLSDSAIYTTYSSGQVTIGASSNPLLFNIPTATGQLLYANPGGNTVSIGATSGNGMLNVNGYSSLASPLFGLNLTSTSTFPYIQTSKNNSTSAQFTSNGVWNIQDGTATTSAYSFINDTDTGMYRLTTNKLGLTTAGVDALTIDSSQRIGIGSTTPSAILTIGTSTSATATSTVFLDSGTGKGGCFAVKDSDGSGYTYVTFNNGVMTASTASCR